MAKRGRAGAALLALLAASQSGCELLGERTKRTQAVSSAHAAERAPASLPRCPPEMSEAAGVCIDRWEAHLVIAGPGSAGSVHPHFQRPPEGARLEARSAKGVMPQAYISRVEAAAACENAGKRLCTAVEWHRACRGPRDTDFPYGPRFEKGRCNVGRPHLLSRFFGTDPNRWSYDHHFNNPKLAREPGFLLAAGERSGCSNDYGVHDMVGNLHEWVSDRVDKTLAARIPLTPGIKNALGRSVGKGVFMGGFFSTTDEHGRGCNFATTAHEATYHDYSTGFRCCRDPQLAASPRAR